MEQLANLLDSRIVLDFRSLFANTRWERFSNAMALTRRQKEVMDFLADFIDRNGYSPSYEEIASGLGLASLATVHKHIQALESKQYLRRSYNHSRSLEVADRFYSEEKTRRRHTSSAPEIPLL